MNVAATLLPERIDGSRAEYPTAEVPVEGVTIQRWLSNPSTRFKFFGFEDERISKYKEIWGGSTRVPVLGKVYDFAKRSEEDHAANLKGMGFWDEAFWNESGGDPILKPRQFNICKYVDKDWVE